MLYGYERENGRYGIRNYVLVIPASVCASKTAVQIASYAPNAVAIPHQHGCCQVGADYKQTFRTLAGFGKNPNVGAVIVVGLGCEGIQAQNLSEQIAKTGKPVECLVIQEQGGTIKTVEKGSKIVTRLSQYLTEQKKKPFSIDKLILGLECGGSDPTSGIASNPAVGNASHLFMKAGGTSILSETTEVIGAEHILYKRFLEPEKGDKFLQMVKNTENSAIKMGEDLRGTQPTPGNIAGGITTIEEKSLGCMYKAGNAPFLDALEYAQEVPAKRGLYFMDTPGEDIDSITGMVAGGAQVVLFTTGRGTPTGCPIAPVIKITGNHDTYKKMHCNIDIDAGIVITQAVSLEDMGKIIYDFLIDVCKGYKTKAEMLGQNEFGIYRIGPTF